MRDLGVIIDSKLMMSQHVSKMVSKARIRANLIFKCFHSRDQHTLLKVFITYVWPLLEYASQVWSPCTAIEIAKVESVQRSFTKRLPGLNNFDYAKRLSILEVESLELCRLHSDIIYVYKMLFGLVNLDFNDFFVLKVDSVTRGHNYKLLKQHHRLNVRKHFFAERMVSVWNNLKCDIINFDNLQNFKLSLMKCDLSKYVNY